MLFFLQFLLITSICILSLIYGTLDSMMESDPQSSSSTVQVGGLSVKQHTHAHVHVHTPHSAREERRRDEERIVQQDSAALLEKKSVNHTKNSLKTVNANSESVEIKLPFGSTAAEKAKNIVRNIMVLVPHIRTPGLYPLGPHRLCGCVSLRCVDIVYVFAG